MDWAEAHCEADFLKKMFLFGRSIFSFFVPRMGSFWEMPFFVAILKKCEVENDADGI